MAGDDVCAGQPQFMWKNVLFYDCSCAALVNGSTFNKRYWNSIKAVALAEEKLCLKVISHCVFHSINCALPNEINVWTIANAEIGLVLAVGNQICLGVYSVTALLPLLWRVALCLFCYKRRFVSFDSRDHILPLCHICNQWDNVLGSLPTVMFDNRAQNEPELLKGDDHDKKTSLKKYNAEIWSKLRLCCSSISTQQIKYVFGETWACELQLLLFLSNIQGGLATENDFQVWNRTQLGPPNVKFTHFILHLLASVHTSAVNARPLLRASVCFVSGRWQSSPGLRTQVSGSWWGHQGLTLGMLEMEECGKEGESWTLHTKCDIHTSPGCMLDEVQENTAQSQAFTWGSTDAPPCSNGSCQCVIDWASWTQPVPPAPTHLSFTWGYTPPLRVRIWSLMA